MRSTNVILMIFVALSLCTCCCVIPACDGRRGWGEGFTELPETQIIRPFESFMGLICDTPPANSTVTQSYLLP
jgi:hypothetical protein